MTDTILKAKTAIVKIGKYEFEGLLFENGKFGVALTQINEQLISFSASNNTLSRDIKRLLGNDFSPSKAKTDTYKQLINTIFLEQLEYFIIELTAQGNKDAKSISKQLIGLSLTQLFSDAFDIKLEKEERQAYLLNRQLTKQTFKQLCDHIKNWIDENPDESPNTKKFIYCHTYDALNRGLFGKQSKKIKEELGITKGDLNRDYFNAEALARVDMVQRLAKGKITSGMNPKLAVEQSISEFGFKVIEYKA